MTRRLPHEGLLDEPVRMPAGHPESYSTRLDALDEELAGLHDRLWPREEWAEMEDCPRLDLDPYPTWRQARNALYAHRRRNGVLRHLFYRIHSCRCGAWHVGPWWLRRSRV